MHTRIGNNVNLCLAALSAVSGFNHYTPHYFEWKAGYDDIIAVFHNECAEMRIAEHDASVRMEKLETLLDKMDNSIIELTSTYYPKNKDGNWAEPEELAAVSPALVVDNTPAEDTSNGDGGGSISADIQPNMTAAEETAPEPVAAIG